LEAYWKDAAMGNVGKATAIPAKPAGTPAVVPQPPPSETPKVEPPKKKTAGC